MAIALLPLILLPMVILAGVMQPLHKMNAAGSALAQVMPSRWAFEGMLLQETDHRPSWTPPAMPPQPTKAGEKPSPAPEPPKAQDMAEQFFPAETDRMGVRAASITLTSMLVFLVGGILIILRLRDVH